MSPALISPMYTLLLGSNPIQLLGHLLRGHPTAAPHKGSDGGSPTAPCARATGHPMQVAGVTGGTSPLAPGARGKDGALKGQFLCSVQQTAQKAHGATPTGSARLGNAYGQLIPVVSAGRKTLLEKKSEGGAHCRASPNLTCPQLLIWWEEMHGREHCPARQEGPQLPREAR